MTDLNKRLHRWTLRRHGLALAVAVTVAAISAPAFAYLTTREEGPRGPRQEVAANNARQEVAHRTSWGDYASIWTAPARNATCTFIQLDSTPGAAFSARGGGTCQEASQQQMVPITVRMSWRTLDDGRNAVLLAGALAPSSGITDVVLEAGDGSRTTLASNDRYFLGELGYAKEHGALNEHYTVVGLDDQATEVARVNLNEVLAEATPK